MYDKAQIENAQKRLLADPNLLARTVSELRGNQAVARNAHPLGFHVLDGELTKGMAGIVALNGPTQLLEAEKLRDHFAERLAGAKVAEDRQNQANRAAARARTEVLRRQGSGPNAAWSQSRGKGVAGILDTLRNQLDRLHERQGGVGTEIELRAIIADIADAARATIAACANEHRESVSRESIAAPVADAA
jgi:hypothetical protein